MAPYTHAEDLFTQATHALQPPAWLCSFICKLKELESQEAV